MRKVVIVVFALALIVCLGGGASAQIVPENHYLVYQLSEPFTADVTVTLYDQFDQFFGDYYTTNNLTMDKFANPVEKNGEPYFNQDIHQTWWQIDHQQDIKQVGFLNQFGLQNWDVGHGRYLVLPAWKDEPQGMDPPFWNHYKCYEAEGPAMNVDVLLHDQWGGFGSVAVDPVLFCNPCIKDVTNGMRYEIVTPEAHLAVYSLDPTFMVDVFATAYDQFGIWQFNAIEAIWLVVPSDKLTVVESETRSWGSIKGLFR